MTREIGYRAIHYRIQTRLGKPNKCWECGRSDPNRRYHWANISGKYLDIDEDWKRMCVPCHKRMDLGNKQWKEYCRNGHRLVLTNIYLHRHATLACRKCKNLQNKKARERVKARNENSNECYEVRKDRFDGETAY